MTATMDAPAGSPRRRRSPAEVTPVAVAIALEGVALAVVVGVEGTLGWRLLRVAAVTALTVAAVTFRSIPAVRLAAGVSGVVVGLGVGMPHLLEVGFGHGMTTVGLVALLAGLFVVGTGVVAVVRRARPWARVVQVPVFVVALAVTVFTLVPPVLATNVPPIRLGDATPADHGFDFEDVTLTTTDGVRLAAWYIPSVNGAAVVLRHGAGSTRSNELDHAAVLASHGYGVLLVDARGHGESGGRAMDFGWYGDRDVGAGIGFLDDRADVDGDRIGVVGMSMGGEEAIGAAGTDGRIIAVVAEGATGRSDRDKRWLSDEYGVRGELQEVLERVQSGVTDLLTSAGKPMALEEAVVRAAPRRFLLIAAGDVPDERKVAARLAERSPGNVDSWVVPGAAHTDGLETAPEEWEARVIGFLDAALG